MRLNGTDADLVLVSEFYQVPVKVGLNLPLLLLQHHQFLVEEVGQFVMIPVVGCMPGGKVQGAGCRVQGSGCRVQGSGFRVQGSGFRVQGPGFRVQGPGSRVQGSGSRVQGSGFRE